MVIGSNILSLFLIEHDQNGVFNHNIHLIQDLMHLEKPSSAKFKRICAYSPNITILKKSATPGNIKLTFYHAAAGNRYLRETITNFDLSGSPKTPAVVSF